MLKAICAQTCLTGAISLALLASRECHAQPSETESSNLPQTVDTWLKEEPFSYSIKRIADGQNGDYYQFEWRKSDWDGKRRTKGTELKSVPMPGHIDQWTAFSVYLPSKSFVGDTKFTIIMQYHGIPDFDLGEGWRNPVTDLIVRDGLLQYDYRASEEQVTPRKGNEWVYSNKGSIKLGAPKFDAWNEIVLHQKFDYHAGSIKIWVNGVEFEQTNVGVGFNDKQGMFFKFGLYCPQKSDKPVKIVRFKNVRLYSGQLFHNEQQALTYIDSELRK
jgi:hypothetical protein